MGAARSRRGLFATAGTLLAICGMSAALSSTPAQAQSISRGRLEGIVRDTSGARFPRARVRLTELASGVSWWLETDQNGTFSQNLMPPGDYEIFVEDVGFQPKRIAPVPVLPGRRQEISIVLAPIELPVQAAAEVPYSQPVEESRASSSLWYTPFELYHLPEERREITELARLSTFSDADLNSEGLPGSLSGIFVDGLPFAAGRHPDLPPGQMIATAFPLSAFQNAELFTNGVDVEWTGFAGAYLSGYTRRGTTQPGGVGYADGSSSELVTSGIFDPGQVSGNSFRGGAVLTGPIVPDTSHYVLGIEAQRLETVIPEPWEIHSFDSELVGVASFAGVDLSPYTRARLQTSDIVSGFGNFDWQVAQSHQLNVRGAGSFFRLAGDLEEDPGLPPPHIASLGAQVEGSDISGAVTLASRFSSVVASELRLGLDRTDRAYEATSSPGTRITTAGQAFGSDPTLPGDFERLTGHFSETVHLDFGRHLLKVGLGLRLEAVNQLYAFASRGLFTFGGTSELDSRVGEFVGATLTPRAEFTNWQLAGYFQDTWNAAPGLQLTGGLRYEFEKLEKDAIQFNSDWAGLTNISNTAFDDGITKLSPRFGFLWNVSERDEWLVRGAAGLYHSTVSPGIFAEAVSQDGAAEIRRGVGDLGAWPQLPGATAAPVQGARLTVLAPDFEPPRTARASLGIARLFGERTSVMVAGTYRFTDRLPRREDLNLSGSPLTRDQYGRPIFGTLVQQGSLITVEPGSNRRFEGFDVVSALDSDGESRYWDVTFTVQRHQTERFDLLAGYTFSWTRDDWLGARGGGLERELNPFPDGLNGEDWRDDRADFDRPSSVVIGAEAKFPETFRGARVAALYRFMTGPPFTPGFRTGVDVNGDGSGWNDPAVVDPNIPGMSALIEEWDCLAEQVAEFAERNSCRGPDVHLLDVRAAVTLIEFFGRPVEVVVDGLNLLDANIGERDSALLLVDREGTIQENPDGSLTLPLVANSHFGRGLAHQSLGRSFRLGVRVGL